jgi:hypothetical protein
MARSRPNPCRSRELVFMWLICHTGQASPPARRASPATRKSRGDAVLRGLWPVGRGSPLPPSAVKGLRGEDGNRMPHINRALTTRRRRSTGNTALLAGRLRCSRAAGISSTAARVAACSAESRSVRVTATLNFGARPRGSTSARSFVLTTPRKRSSASAGPPRSPDLSRARLTSKAISSTASVRLSGA